MAKNVNAELESLEQHMQGQNPAQSPEKVVAERVRIPMTSPMRRLETPELPGWWLQWIRGTPERMQQAKRAFFEHVLEYELDVNNRDIGGDAKTSGNSDLGSIISTSDGSGERGYDGQAIRMYLMKQRKEHHDEDVAINQRRNDSVVDSLTVNFRQGTVGMGADGAPAETPVDMRQRYVGSNTAIPEIFKRKVDRS